MEKNCIFCKIIKSDLPSSVVFENDEVLAIMDINPINFGHVLVMPKKHYQSLREVPTELSQKIFAVVTKIEKALWEIDRIKCEGTNILQNNGRSAWQEVFHLHFHIIPRFAGDNFRIKYVAKKPERVELDAVCGAIRGKIGFLE